MTKVNIGSSQDQFKGQGGGRAAPKWGPGVRPANDNRPERPKRPKLRVVDMADVEPEAVTWFWPPYIPRGKLTIISGDPGVGKSWLTLAIAAAASKGEALPGARRGAGSAQKVLLIAFEDGLADTVRPRLDALKADPSNIKAVAKGEPGQKRFTLDSTGLDALDQLMAEIKPDLVIIDPVSSYIGSKVDMHRENQVRDYADGLAQLAEKHGCAILAVRHLRKGGGGKAIYAGLGSIALTAAARSELHVGRDEEKHGPDLVIMAHPKCNVGPSGPSLSYELRDGTFEWRGEVAATAEDLVREPPRNADPRGVDRAMAFLQEALKNGEVPSKDLMAWAKDESISKRTLRRAQERLGTFARQEGGKWYTSLPPTPSKTPRQSANPPNTGTLAP